MSAKLPLIMVPLIRQIEPRDRILEAISLLSIMTTKKRIILKVVELQLFTSAILSFI